MSGRKTTKHARQLQVGDIIRLGKCELPPILEVSVGPDTTFVLFEGPDPYGEGSLLLVNRCYLEVTEPKPKPRHFRVSFDVTYPYETNSDKDAASDVRGAVQSWIRKRTTTSIEVGDVAVTYEGRA